MAKEQIKRYFGIIKTFELIKAGDKQTSLTGTDLLKLIE